MLFLTDFYALFSVLNILTHLTTNAACWVTLKVDISWHSVIHTLGNISETINIKQPVVRVKLYHFI